MSERLRLVPRGPAEPNIVPFPRGRPHSDILDNYGLQRVARRVGAIHNQLSTFSRDPSPESVERVRQGMISLDILAAELRGYNVGPWRDLLDVATAIRAGGRRHALRRLAWLGQVSTRRPG